MKKIEERKEEVELTISQLEEFEVAVDKALSWVSEQEVSLDLIVVVDDEESIAPLVVSCSVFIKTIEIKNTVLDFGYNNLAHG